MTRVVRNAALLCACVGGLMLAGAALASTPDEAQSTLGSNWPRAAWRKWLVVEGFTTATLTNGGARTPDRPDVPATVSFYGDYEVTINNNAGSPLSGVSVCIDFSGCPDVRLSCDQLTAETGQTLVGTTTVCGNTNSAGKFTFKVQGAGKAKAETSPLTTVGSLADTTVAGCAQVTANTTPFNQKLKVTIYDVNGTGSPSAAVSGADAALIAIEATRTPGSNPAYARSDYNHDAKTTGADASASSIMATQAAATTETGSRMTAPYCP